MAISKFGQAFADARKSGLKTFEFNGKKYTTNISEEVEQPSLGRVKAGEYVPRDASTQRANRAMSDNYVPRDAMEQRANRALSDNYVTRAGLGGGAGRGGQGGPSADDLYDAGAGRGRVNPSAEGMKKGGKVSSASKRADGIAVKGKTRGKMV
jgi:hypothetical protein